MNFEDYMGWKLSAKRSRGDWRFDESTDPNNPNPTRRKELEAYREKHGLEHRIVWNPGNPMGIHIYAPKGSPNTWRPAEGGHDRHNPHYKKSGSGPGHKASEFGDHEFSVSVTKPPKRDKTGRLIPSRLRTSTVKNPDTTSGDLDEKTTAPFMSPSERRKGYRASNKASSVRENSPEWQKKWGRGLVERVINRASEFGDMNEFISGSLKRRLSPEQQEAHTRSYRRGQFSPWAWYSSSQGGGKTWSRPDASIGYRGSAGAGKKGGPYRLNPMRGKGEYGQSVRDTLKERGDKEKISGVARGQSMYSPSSKGRSPEGTLYRQQRDRKQIYSSEFGEPMRNFGDDQFLLFFANQYPEAFQEVAGEFHEFGLSGAIGNVKTVSGRDRADFHKYIKGRGDKFANSHLVPTVKNTHGVGNLDSETIRSRRNANRANRGGRASEFGDYEFAQKDGPRDRRDPNDRSRGRRTRAEANRQMRKKGVSPRDRLLAGGFPESRIRSLNSEFEDHKVSNLNEFSKKRKVAMGKKMLRFMEEFQLGILNGGEVELMQRVPKKDIPPAILEKFSN